MRSLLLLLIVCGLIATHAFVLEKGANITDEIEAGIRKSIKDSVANCTLGDRSCMSQVVGLKIQNLFGKSWNIHLLDKTTSMIKGRQYSHDRWISLVNEGEGNSAYSYYIFKPIDCSKPFSRLRSQVGGDGTLPKQYWGSSVTQSLKTKIRQILEDGYKNSQVMDENAEYIETKLGPGRWEVIIWNTSSFDYMNTCMYASYFGLIVGVDRGTASWTYYIGRMSLI